MTNENPFSTPAAQLLPSPAQPSAATHQPYLFIAALAVASALVFIVNIGWQLMSELASHRERVLDYLPMMTANWAGGMLLYSAAVLLLVHQQRERYGIARFEPQAILLAAYAGLYLLVSLGVGTAIAYFSLPFYEWAMEQEGRSFWMVLHSLTVSLLSWALGCILPLWCVLRAARQRSELASPARAAPVEGWQVAVGIALCFSGLLHKTLAMVAKGAMYLYLSGDAWQSIGVLGSCLLPFVIVMAAVQTRLPSQVSRFAAGRVLACALVLLALWGVAIILVSLVVAFAAYSSLNSNSLPLYLLPPAILLLALLWPLARWCTGWFFADQLAR